MLDEGVAMTDKRKKLLEKLWCVLPYLWLAAGYLILLWYQFVPGKWLVDSDMAGEMMLADLLNKEGGIVSTNWYYSTELRVLNTQLFYKIGLLLFPQNWHAARVLSMAVLLALFVAAYLFLAKQAGFFRLGAWTAAALIWPFGQWYLFLTLYSGFHVTYGIQALFAMGLTIGLIRGKPRKISSILFALLLAMLSFGCGLNGVRMSMMFFTPLLAGSLFLLLLAIQKKEIKTKEQLFTDCKQEIRTLGWAGFGFGFNVFGYLINSLVLSKLYSFKDYNVMEWREDFSLHALGEVLGDFLGLFGYESGEKLFGFGGLAACCGMGLAVLIVLSFIRLCRRFGELELVQQLLVTFLGAGIGISAVVFSFTSIAYSTDYWLPLVPFVLVMLQIEGETEKMAFVPLRRGAVLLFAAMITVASLGTIRYELEHPMRGQKRMPEVVQTLLENGCTQGYASFWNGQVLTELSNGEIAVWSVTSPNTLLVQAWLQETSRTTQEPQGRVFILINHNIDEEVDKNPFALSGRGEIIMDDDDYWIVVYDSVEEVKEILETAGGQAD